MPSLRILHLEDCAADAELAAVMLRRSGLETTIESAQTRDEFVRAIRHDTFDVVLSDHALPGFDGLTALRLLRARDRMVPFILVTGALGEEAAIELMRAGVTDYVLKDHLARLAGCITRAVAEAGERREREHAELALRRSEQRFHVALATMAEGVVLLDAEGRVHAANASAARILGAPVHEQPGISILDIPSRYYVESGELLLPPRLPPLVVLRTGQPHDNVTLRVVRTDGTGVWVEISTRPILTGGQLDGVVMTLHDVTERRMLESHLAQAQKMDAIGTLAGGIAHDFNNVLGLVLGYADLLLEDTPPDAPLRTELESIRQAAHQGAALTGQLLAFSRKQRLEMTDVDAADVARSVERLLARVIGEDITLVVTGDDDLHTIRADRGQLEQVLMNLAVNARDAMPRGGRLTIETRNVELDARYLSSRPNARPGRHMMITVADTGDGMTPEVRARIFEPFFTTKPRGKGTGLGLATVYGIVKQCGGSIEVHSEPGRGATFKLFFPAVDDAPTRERPAADAAVPEAPCESATILLVEDNERLRKLMAHVLEMRGYRVLDAESGEAALLAAQALATPPNLLLTDAVLPGVSGSELARQLQTRWPDIKVIFVSGYTDDTMVNYGLLDADQPFLQKPFSPTALEQKVSDVLAAHESHR